MDKKEFLDKLTEVAEWVYPMVSENGRGLERLGLQKLTDRIHWFEQPQVGPRIIKFKTESQCNWCNKKKQNTHIAYKKSSVYKCWLAYCYTCGKHIDPETGEMSKSANKLRALKK